MAPLKVTPLTNLDEVTAQGLCYCNSDPWGWQNSYQGGVIGINGQLILQNGKNAPRCTGGTVTCPKHCHATHLTQR